MRVVWFDYVDVLNMSASLVKTQPDQARQLSYDSVHWGMEVNMIKAQILLHALAQTSSYISLPISVYL
jgi:hypothetical protein